MIGRRDPQGYYVLIARREALGFVEADWVEDLGGGLVALKIRSRSLAIRICKKLRALGLLVEEP